MINGPVAIAGSILFFSRTIGTMVPIIAATIITAKREIEMVTETIKSLWLINKLNPKIIKESIIPEAAETLTSLNKVLKVSFPKVLFAKPCTIIAEA